jgi:hypothetical protein
MGKGSGVTASLAQKSAPCNRNVRHIITKLTIVITSIYLCTSAPSLPLLGTLWLASIFLNSLFAYPSLWPMTSNPFCTKVPVWLTSLRASPISARLEGCKGKWLLEDYLPRYAAKSLSNRSS